MYRTSGAQVYSHWPGEFSQPIAPYKNCSGCRTGYCVPSRTIVLVTNWIQCPSSMVRLIGHLHSEQQSAYSAQLCQIQLPSASSQPWASCTHSPGCGSALPVRRFAPTRSSRCSSDGGLRNDTHDASMVRIAYGRWCSQEAQHSTHAGFPQPCHHSHSPGCYNLS